MNVFVVGGGGREHALVWKIAQDSSNPVIYCAPGNAGTAGLATNVPIAAEDVPGLVAWAREHRPDLTVVGPEVPLCAGLVDELEAIGLRAFGPSRAAARMEGSKRFAKEVMIAAGVPTARAQSFTSADAACAALAAFGLPVVIKADGLAAGKGVVIAQTRDEAVAAIRSMLVENAFGAAGAEVLIEEFLDGEEASILACVDGEHIALLPASQDHKRVFDADQGPNTGGMGAYSPAPVVTDDLLPLIRSTVIEPVVAELRKRGIVYKGILYAGLMVGTYGIRVLEFNVRFGDPETEVILPRLAGDILPLFAACIDGTLTASSVRVTSDPAVTVILAAGGYPGPYAKGIPIHGLDAAAACDRVVVFHAGTTVKQGQAVTAGGRVLAVTATGPNLRAAVANAYTGVRAIRFEGAHYRTDIAHRALERI
jgi:phosphoribosylamine--glycine ligase